MKIAIQYEKNSTGKSKFIQRLIPALERNGVEIVTSKPDLTLGLSYWKKKPKGRKVIRIDGIHLEKDKKYDWRRKMIKHTIKTSDGVIYQTKFAYDMVTKILGVRGKKEFIIYNGANPEDYKVEPMDSEYPKNVIVSGRYVSSKVRPHKRMREMIRIAENYIKKHSDVCFWFCGKIREERKSKEQIKYVGDVSEKLLRRYLVMADVMVSICWFSWCDNAVVEALAAGTPVISGNIGGNAEIVKEYGAILPLDSKPIKPTLQKNSPPPIDTELVEKALDGLLSYRKTMIVPAHIHIDTIARQYKKAFESVLIDVKKESAVAL